MAGVLPLIDTAYDIAVHSSVRLIRFWLSLFEPPVTSLYLPKDLEYDEEPTRESSKDLSLSERVASGESHTPTLVRGKNTVMYAATKETPLYNGPTIAFDSCKTTIPYGALVLVVEPAGRFYRVIWDTHEGWVLKEHLADRASMVYPEFVHGEENSVDHTNTARVRALIRDEFGLGNSEFSLQAGEYVLYRLMRRGVRIVWPNDHVSRAPGSWHTILRGAPHIHIGVMPRVGSILEYADEHGMGHVAYVEAVFPDSMIAISEANFPHSGIYSERTLAKDVWRALRPVFIEVSEKQAEV